MKKRFIIIASIFPLYFAASDPTTTKSCYVYAITIKGVHIIQVKINISKILRPNYTSTLTPNYTSTSDISKKTAQLKIAAYLMIKQIHPSQL